MKSVQYLAANYSCCSRPALRRPHSSPSEEADLRHTRCLKVRVGVQAALEQRETVQKQNEGHSALLQGLGEVGDVSTQHVPWLLRLAHIRCPNLIQGIPRALASIGGCSLPQVQALAQCLPRQHVTQITKYAH